MSDWGHLADRFANDRPRKMLSIDGGGIRGVLALEVLRSIESLLAERAGTGRDFRLRDTFDYIAGTSTGSVVAACLALGMSVDEILDWYTESGPAMFDPETMARALRDPDFHPMSDALAKRFGTDTNLDSDRLSCLLMVVMHNNTTDSAWPVTNNPLAKYNDRSRDDCNLKIPLWRLVRGSVAYPGVFAPEKIQLGSDPKKAFLFDDGGVSPYINPAFLLFRMATLEPYRLQWKSGERELLLISVGTGTAPNSAAFIHAPAPLGPSATSKEIAEWAGSLNNLVSVVMYDAQVDQDVNCRSIGRCIHGRPIDVEIGDLIARDGDGEPLPPSQDLGRAFLYARYQARLTKAGLTELGIDDIDASAVRSMAAIDQIDNLRRIGRKVGEQVRLEHFGSFV